MNSGLFVIVVMLLLDRFNPEIIASWVVFIGYVAGGMIILFKLDKLINGKSATRKNIVTRRYGPYD